MIEKETEIVYCSSRSGGDGDTERRRERVDSALRRSVPVLVPKEKKTAGESTQSPAGKTPAEKSGKDPEEALIPEEKPKKKKKHGFGIVLLILLFLLLTEFLLIYLFAGKLNYQPYEEITEESGYGLPGKYEKGVVNILLIGSDTRNAQERGQSDSMILVSVCPLQHKIYLTSFLRDSYVDIPGIGQNRLNHAYTMGGARLLLQTIEKNYRIRIDSYFRVDFGTFIRVIDDFGGVELTVDAGEVHYVDAYLSEINQLMELDARDSFIDREGTYVFNGRQALAYSRIRYIGTDFGRTERQREVLKALVKKLRSNNPVTTVKAVSAALSEVVTGMDRLELTAFLMRCPFLLFYSLESSQIPADGTWQNALTESGQEVLSIDFEANRRVLRERIYSQ